MCACAGVKHVGSLVENAISGTSMGTLIYQPSGCGEQNMIHMTLPVIATIYLDKTNQWETVGFQKRSEALQHIKTGRFTYDVGTDTRNVFDGPCFVFVTLLN